MYLSVESRSRWFVWGLRGTWLAIKASIQDFGILLVLRRALKFDLDAFDDINKMINHLCIYDYQMLIRKDAGI